MGLFDYIKKNWKDYPDTSTPVNAANLNYMDNQIAKLSEGANSHEESIGTIEDRLDGIDSSLTASDNLQFQFATDGEGNYGFLGADGSLIPFKSRNIEILYAVCYVPYNSTASINENITVDKNGICVITISRFLGEEQETTVFNVKLNNEAIQPFYQTEEGNWHSRTKVYIFDVKKNDNIIVYGSNYQTSNYVGLSSVGIII